MFDKTIKGMNLVEKIRVSIFINISHLRNILKINVITVSDNACLYIYSMGEYYLLCAFIRVIAIIRVSIFINISHLRNILKINVITVSDNACLHDFDGG